MSDEDGAAPGLPSFAHLRRLHPNRRTAWIELPDVAPSAALEGLFAGPENRALTAAQLKQKPVIGTSPEALQLGLARSLELCARHVLVGWRGIVDSSNRPVQFSAEFAIEFLRQLPVDISLRVWKFFENRANFIDSDAPSEVAAELSGN